MVELGRLEPAVDPQQRAVLLVFVKAPRPGAVKTRLAAAVGEDAAAALYRAMAELVMEATAPAGEYQRLVCFDPPDAGDEIRAWLGDQALVPQAAGDLGQRLAAAFAEAFRRGASRVVVIGTDALDLSRDVVCRALAALDQHDLVVGPALDGGYCLLALDRPRPELFQEMPWSTPSVLPETLARAAARGWRVHLLEARGDVDTLDDVRREWDRLRPLLVATAHAAAFQAALERAR